MISHEEHPQPNAPFSLLTLPPPFFFLHTPKYEQTFKVRLFGMHQYNMKTLCYFTEIGYKLKFNKNMVCLGETKGRLGGAFHFYRIIFFNKCLKRAGIIRSTC